MSIHRLHRQTQLLPASRHNLYSAEADLSFYFMFMSRLLTDLRSTLKARQLCRVAPESPEILEAWCQGWAVTLSAALSLQHSDSSISPPSSGIYLHTRRTSSINSPGAMDDWMKGRPKRCPLTNTALGGHFQCRLERYLAQIEKSPLIYLL